MAYRCIHPMLDCAAGGSSRWLMAWRAAPTTIAASTAITRYFKGCPQSGCETALWRVAPWLRWRAKPAWRIVWLRQRL